MTYLQLLEQAKTDAKGGSAMAVAQLIAATRMMRTHGPNAQVDTKEMSSQTLNIMNRNSFKQLMRDPQAKALWESGDNGELNLQLEDLENPKMSYRKFMKAATQDAADGSPVAAANMMSAAMMMQGSGANAEVEQAKLAEMSSNLMKQTAFKELMKDPKALELMKQGKALDMISLMADKQYEKEHRYDEYKRSGEFLTDDRKLLQDYMKSTAGVANAGEVQLEGKGRPYREMMKQIEQAQQLMEQGIPLSGDQAKALTDAVMKYNDNGSGIAGGRASLNKHYTQNMTLLKHFLPAKEFDTYCANIKTAHPRSRETRTENFVPGRLTGKVKTAGELTAQYKKDLQNSFSEDGVAAICAIRTLSKGDKYFTISDDMLKREKDKLLAHGSAFRRTVTNPEDRKILKDLTRYDDMRFLAKEVSSRSRNHAIGSAQWRLDQSSRALQSGTLNRHNASYHLATIVLAQSIAKGSNNPAQKIDPQSFAESLDATQTNKDFQSMVDRYVSDPDYRKKINEGLRKNTTGQTVTDELVKLEHPKANRVKEVNAEKPAEQAQTQKKPDLVVERQF
ncbi:MAG: hypothetical protein K5772_08305 [Clostridia bacterium]|nr:hypothetical protein [Clostridia bacterium]